MLGPGLLSTPQMMPIPGQPGVGPSLLSPTVPTIYPSMTPTIPVPAPHQGLLARAMPVPTGLQGLLTDEDIKQARAQGLLSLGAGLLADSRGQGYGPAPSLGQAIGHGIQSGLQGYQQALQGAVQTRLGGAQVADQLKLQQARAQIEKQFAAPPYETAPQRLNRLSAMAAAYAQAGDIDSATKVAELVKSMRGNGNLQAVQAGDAVYTFDPNTGTYTVGPQRGMPADEKELKHLQLDEQRARTQEMELQHTESMNRQMSQAFLSRNAKLVQTMNNYANAMANFAEARAGNPAALESSIMSMAANADPRAQLRQGIIEMVQKVDPSWRGTWQMALHKITSGTLPPYVLDDMQRLVQHIHDNYAGLYAQQRAAEVKRHPALDAWIPSVDELFAMPGTTSPMSAAPVMSGDPSKVRQFLNP